MYYIYIYLIVTSMAIIIQIRTRGVRLFGFFHGRKEYIQLIDAFTNV